MTEKNEPIDGQYRVTDIVPVQPLWCARLPLQQQSVLFLASRGPDGVGEHHHPCKAMQQAYRACVFLAARYGRSLQLGEKADSFMRLDEIVNYDLWMHRVEDFINVIDSLPHHYITHFMHGVEILAYKHPDDVLRLRWMTLYLAMVDSLHLCFESKAMMDHRLGDWARAFWAPIE